MTKQQGRNRFNYFAPFIKVMAEGIETQQQPSTLAAAGCDFGQGFLLSRPISGEELKEKLQKQVDPVNK